MDMAQYDQHQKDTLEIFDIISIEEDNNNILPMEEWLLRYGDELDKQFETFADRTDMDYQLFMRNKYREYSGHGKDTEIVDRLDDKSYGQHHKRLPALS